MVNKTNKQLKTNTYKNTKYIKQNTYIILIIFGLINSIFTGVKEFVFESPANAFAMSLGILLGGLFLLIINKIFEVKNG